MDSFIVVIGLDLAPTAARLSGLPVDNPDIRMTAIALFTLFVTILSMTIFRGLFRDCETIT